MGLDLPSFLEMVDVPSRESEAVPHYYVKPIPNFERHYFGKTGLGAPCLLLRTDDSSLKTPIRLAEIEVCFATPCVISITGDERRRETLTAISCTVNDPIIHSYFAHVCEMILQIVGPSPSLMQVVTAVQRLIELFQKLSEPSKCSVVGLIGELYVIYAARLPKIAVEAWRSGTDDRFDFSIDDVRLEVKASNTRQRSHNFSLEQCSPPPNTNGVLISLFIEASGGGLSLHELIVRIEETLGGDTGLLLKLQETIAGGLGQHMPTALSMRFDESLARSSLQAYDLTSIPAVCGQPPPEVSQVRFRSDITHVPVADMTNLAHGNRTLKSLLPRAGAIADSRR